ncbi:unnamed protein product [Linum trigynum]|uniref:DUF295 domain-containing protein n=1 Tax=Linum trigynum TaxID=586398 RepID=A0AAV2FIT4_9ROSI
MVGENGRPWADLCPDLLNLINDKLPHYDAVRHAVLGSVCKPWRQVHRAARRQPPLRPCQRCRDPRPAGYRLHSKTPELVESTTVPGRVREELCGQIIACALPSRWWLLKKSADSPGGEITGCFNPFLPWPHNHSKLPLLPASLTDSSPRGIRAGFSAPPTSDPAAGDWTILVAGAGGGATFSTYRRGGRFWKRYSCDYLEGQHCLGVGFQGRDFFCLFERGDVVIFGIDGGAGTRTLLADAPPPRPQPPLISDLTVVERDGEHVLMSWEERGYDETGDFRLAEAEDAAEAEAEAGENRGRAVVFVTEHAWNYIDLDASIPYRIRLKLEDESIVYKWPSSGWTLRQDSHSFQIVSCFNPLLPWPQNYIRLPDRSRMLTRRNSRRRIIAAFSRDPTAAAGDWTILVVGAWPWSLSTFRRGDCFWKNYHHYDGRSSGEDYRSETDCVGIGFWKGRFFCLFESGDVLIFGTRDGYQRRMLAPLRPLQPGRLCDNPQIVEVGGGTDWESCVVVSWERVSDRHCGCDGGGGTGRRWRLAKVERRRKEETERMVQLADKERMVIVRGKPNHRIMRGLSLKMH